MPQRDALERRAGGGHNGRPFSLVINILVSSANRADNLREFREASSISLHSRRTLRHRTDFSLTLPTVLPWPCSRARSTSTRCPRDGHRQRRGGAGQLGASAALTQNRAPHLFQVVSQSD